MRRQALAQISPHKDTVSSIVARKPVQKDARESQFDSKAEEDFFTNVLGRKAIPHPLTLHTLSGGRYTPDFLAFVDGVPTLFEVKGSYRLHSQDGANRRFLEAAAEFGEVFSFVWAVRTKGGEWEIKKAVSRLSDLSAMPAFGGSGGQTRGGSING